RPTLQQPLYSIRCCHNIAVLRTSPGGQFHKSDYETFDLALAKIAREWGKKCIFEHNPIKNIHPKHEFRPFGETMYRTPAKSNPFDPAIPISKFHDQVIYYNYSSNTCEMLCKDYLQVSCIFRSSDCQPFFYLQKQKHLKVTHFSGTFITPKITEIIVSANTYKVGCAVIFCRQSQDGRRNSATFVCNYGPSMKVGVQPYKPGRPCSNCPEGDKCQNRLCSKYSE
ncbi:glioma pathogenesis-related protein 1-like, partial [Lacerta agilis]|uniref:glioma pathogenesis-related protein 1-like n=1 Tax=Lacerta agilis TaxID=80427 RepID=UPI001419407E